MIGSWICKPGVLLLAEGDECKAALMSKGPGPGDNHKALHLHPLPSVSTGHGGNTPIRHKDWGLGARQRQSDPEEGPVPACGGGWRSGRALEPRSSGQSEQPPQPPNRAREFSRGLG